MKDIEGYEGLYAIEINGAVWAYPKKSRLNGRWLKQTINRCGYSYVCLFKNGETKNVNIHSLVAKSFVSGRDEGLQINHIDGNKSNNNASNLEWVSASENRKHSFRIGTSRVSEKLKQVSSARITAYNKSKEGRERSRANAIKCNLLKKLNSLG